MSRKRNVTTTRFIDVSVVVDEDKLIDKITTIASIPVSRPTRAQIKKWNSMYRLMGEQRPTDQERNKAFRRGVVL